MTFSECELAATIAETAGKLLLDLRASGLFERKALGEAGDHVGNTFIIAALREQRPDDSEASERHADPLASSLVDLASRL